MPYINPWVRRCPECGERLSAFESEKCRKCLKKARTERRLKEHLKSLDKVKGLLEEQKETPQILKIKEDIESLKEDIRQLDLT